MGLGAAACVLIGVFPGLLYQHLPYPVDYAPYTLRHVLATVGLLSFTAFGFFWLLPHVEPVATISLDTDWFYRKVLPAWLDVVGRALALVERFAGRTFDFVVERHLLGVSASMRDLDIRVVDATLVGVGRVTGAIGDGMRAAVSGNAQHYGLLMAAGVLAAVVFALFGS
jgi:multicomponent Na+:H+ antiporter subunit D